ncbi:hypothetical protein Tcan_11177 [Toxocara canis]|uniref:Uncharacterized protein n=2 Tax=Toxocara canis TaxID=6265 RepID=A0A0B2VC81_TOXCA|nr:hypothetical protein Tcan_11177 [Toxocara canis]VDM25404.1 unnamed protein product [Toxocara canis]
MVHLIGKPVWLHRKCITCNAAVKPEKQICLCADGLAGAVNVMCECVQVECCAGPSAATVMRQKCRLRCLFAVTVAARSNNSTCCCFAANAASHLCNVQTHSHLQQPNGRNPHFS